MQYHWMCATLLVKNKAMTNKNYAKTVQYKCFSARLRMLNSSL